MALGRVRFGRALGGVGDGFGRGLGMFWEGFSEILGDSGQFWAGLFGLLRLLALLCWCSLLLAAPLLELKFKISSCFCLLLFAWPCVCITKYGTHFELKL